MKYGGKKIFLERVLGQQAIMVNKIISYVTKKRIAP